MTPGRAVQGKLTLKALSLDAIEALRGGQVRLRQVIFILLVLVALVRAGWLIAQPAPDPVLPAALTQTLRTAGPCWLLGEVVSVTRHGPRSLRFAFQVQALASGPDVRRGVIAVRPEPKVWLSWVIDEARQSQLNLHAGERWLLPVRWRAMPSRSAQGEFDTRRWMQQQQLAAWGTVVGAGASPWGAQRLGQGGSHMQSLREWVRERIAARIENPRRSALVAALSMGDQNAIASDDWEIFRRTGVAHLVSISGMHVTLLAVWLAALVDCAWRRLHWRGHAWALHCPAPVAAQWVALVMAAVYAWFSGWGLPAQRTVWMLLATAALRALNANWPAHAVWLGLIALVAAFDPLALSQAGFWLSYVAVGVLYTMQTEAGQSPLRRWLTETLDVQWRITLALAPLTLLFFQSVSVAGLWVNMWAIPWVTFVVTPLSLLGMACPPLWVAAGWASEWFLLGLEWAAASPWALIDLPSPSVAMAAICTALAARAVCPGPWLWRCACVGLVLVLLAQGRAPSSAHDQPWP